MTREELIECINDDLFPRSCPVYNCNLPEENDSACRICAEKQLKEYEDKIRAEAIDDCLIVIRKNQSKFITDKCYSDVHKAIVQLKEKKNVSKEM